MSATKYLAPESKPARLYLHMSTICVSLQVQVDRRSLVVEKLMDRWFLLPLAPGVELLVGALLVGGVAVFLRASRRRMLTENARGPILLRITAGVVILVWIVDVLVKMLWVRSPDIPWWTFAAPLIVAAAGILVGQFGTPRRPQRSGTPAFVAIPRTWRSFVDPRIMAVAITAASLIVVMTLICGTLSSPDEYGRYVYLKFGDAGTTTFYGWAFGVPVLMGVAFLLVVARLSLTRTASPPFINPATVPDETRSRRTASNAVAYLVTSVLVLTLGAVLGMVGAAGSGAAGVGIPGVGTFMWSPGYSSFAGFFTWVGWALRVAALATLAAQLIGLVPPQTVATYRRSTPATTEQVR